MTNTRPTTPAFSWFVFGDAISLESKKQAMKHRDRYDVVVA